MQFKICITTVSFLLLAVVTSNAQQKVALPHGMVFGEKPQTIAPVPASKIETYMYRKTRFNTAISGKIIRVTQPKGGWFEVDAGNGKIIAAHFKNANVNLPVQIKGRTVIMEGVAQKQFIADDGQHLAGDTVVGKKQHKVNADPKRRLTFEVRGLMVDK
ncbi:DUF4920 domain-containing protein [Mucilaginibacter pallidiroseus]|uniref:DUF4920 domain-containing protein n=1 Tax=Mucilaginibacter pallidiroseus TaxID=2599295 RepID=A0A563UEZ6_9SPHI|nr:DUF4920 domain-containing protein [Mucilaginibacter pallidiroseus]TWR29876.1 DUF4920 domain-containing protein [Mucilaginibacter pallidiroseus]